MRSYPQRVRDSILPRSVARSLPKAFEEWSVTGHTIDYGEAVETCQLCEHEHLRYHFEIRNTLTSEMLLVGSKCILTFDIPVFENGVRLATSQAKKKLEHLIRQKRLDLCLRALEGLANTENNARSRDILRKALAFYQKNKYLTPKFAFVVLWRLAHHRIDHSPSFFKISLRKAKYREDLRQMPLSRVHTIWPALTSTQRTQALAMGHVPPGKGTCPVSS